MHKLNVSCNSPAVVQQALDAKELERYGVHRHVVGRHSNLHNLTLLNIRWPAPPTNGEYSKLADCLTLIKAATKLQVVTIRADVTEWAHVNLYSLTNDTPHVTKLHLVSVIAASTVTQRLCVTGMFLSLPNLSTLNDTHTLTLDQINAARSQNDLSSVQFNG